MKLEMASPRSRDWNRIEEWLRNMAELHDSITGVDEVVAAVVTSSFVRKA